MPKKYNVVFIQPPTPSNKKITRNCDCGTESKANYMWQPYDFLLLSSRFDPEYFHLFFIDGVADKLTNENVFKKCSDSDLFILGFADAVWQDDFNFLKETRKNFPNSLIFCLGDAFLEEYNCELALSFCDGILKTPLFFDPLKYIETNRNEVKSNFLKDIAYTKLDQKNPSNVTGFLPRHDLFQHSMYRWPIAHHKKYTTIHTAWGCPYSCSYCPIGRLNFLTKSNEDIIKEMIWVKKLGFKEIYIGDKSFGIPLAKTKELLQLMINEKLNFSWSVYLHPNQFSVELIELMSRAGCHTIIIGIESIKKENLKIYNRNVKIETYDNLISTCHRNNISVCADFIFGLKNENENDCKETINYALSSNIDYAAFYILSPLPGTSVRKELIEKKIITKDSHNFNLVTKESIVPSELLSATELEYIRKYAIAKFYLRPRYLLKRFLSIRSFEHFSIQIEEMFQLIYKSIKQ